MGRIPFDEKLSYLLGPHVVVSCKLHEFYDLLLDVSMPLMQCFIVFLHLQLDLSKKGCIYR
jgi:hypothetical protein